MKDNKQSSRWKYIQQTSLAGAGLMLTNPLRMFAQKPPMITNMPTRKLGKLEVSARGFGVVSLICGHIGPQVDCEKGIGMIWDAYEQEVTFFDTAEV